MKSRELLKRMKYNLILIINIIIFIFTSANAQTANANDRQSNIRSKTDMNSTVYRDEYLTGLDFPIGALGGSLIRMNGKAERNWWQIFNNFEERSGSGIVPNSFFAIRAKTNKSTIIKVLQTSSIGDFQAMENVTFQGEYPFGWFNFHDKELPVKVTMEAYNPLIPMDLKNSAIPCAIFRIRVANPSPENVEVSILGTQQNAVGFNGYDTITGPNSRNYKGYGKNQTIALIGKDKTSLKMTGAGGSMQLSAYETNMSYTASWSDLSSLFNDFSADGRLAGEMRASSPEPGKTVDGALAKVFSLNPGQEKIITFVLSWYFPKGSFGRKDIPQWYFPEGGSHYENWWVDAGDVDNYVKTNFNYLDSTTRLYHQTMYSSNIPRYVLDRLTSNICVLKSPTSFWTKGGYFGLWESTSDHEIWMGNCKHVYHYAQGHARLYPELGRILRKQDLNTITNEGLLPSRDGQLFNAMDGHFGSILGVYREHLLSDNNDFLMEAWPRTKKAMDYAISTYDSDKDGMMSGSYHNTLDCNVSGTSPWIGSLYMAALKACEKMATIMGDSKSALTYNEIFSRGVSNQNSQLWDNNLGYYKEKTENLPDTLIIGEAISIDMLLGQWWANQLNLGQIYPVDRTKASLSKIYKSNKITDSGNDYKPSFRDFLGRGDTGWQMFKHQGKVPANTILYYDEVMSGFEYAAAATMIQYEMIDEGLGMVNAIANRYDGRLRAEGEVHMASHSAVYGCGSPFGEDECGDFYGRPLSSWSVLLALQGFVYNGPEQKIGFKPQWQPTDHTSFFSSANGWGLFKQKQNAKFQSDVITIAWGKLEVAEIRLAVNQGCQVDSFTIKVNGKSIAGNITQDQHDVVLKLKKSINISSGQKIEILLNLKKSPQNPLIL